MSVSKTEDGGSSPHIGAKIYVMKFNLKDWQNGAKVKTRNGFEVEGLTLLKAKTNYPLVGVINGETCTWTIDGQMWRDGGKLSHDLMIAEPEIWVYTWKTESGRLHTSATYPTLDEAAKMAKLTLKPEEFGGVYKLEAYDIFDIQWVDAPHPKRIKLP